MAGHDGQRGFGKASCVCGANSVHVGRLSFAIAHGGRPCFLLGRQYDLYDVEQQLFQILVDHTQHDACNYNRVYSVLEADALGRSMGVVCVAVQSTTVRLIALQCVVTVL